MHDPIIETAQLDRRPKDAAGIAPAHLAQPIGTRRGLLGGESHRSDPPHEKRAFRVRNDLGDALAMHGGDDRDAAAYDGARSLCVFLGRQLVHDDNVRALILNGLDHHAVLVAWVLNSEHPRIGNRFVRDHARARNLKRLVHDHHDAFVTLREQPRELAKHSRLSHIGRAHYQKAALGKLGERAKSVAPRLHVGRSPRMHVGRSLRRHEHRQHSTLDHAADTRRNGARLFRHSVDGARDTVQRAVDARTTVAS